eukprot:4897810-Pyramimonas_sp.AAC.1
MRVRLSIPELGTRSAARTRFANLFYCSSHPEKCCRFSALNSCSRGGCGAGNDRGRFADIRRVRSSHSEVKNYSL